MGVEPTTSSLGSLHSTGELRPLVIFFSKNIIIIYAFPFFVKSFINKAFLAHACAILSVLSQPELL